LPFQNENILDGLPKLGPFQAGRSDVDPGNTAEIGKGGQVLGAPDPADSWLYFDCTVECVLDSGIVVHRRLPQVNNAADSLGASPLDAGNYNTLTPDGSPTNAGVNLRSLDQYADIVQRMGHARYWFRLVGQALRVGYQVPIPKLVKIGGVAAIPDDGRAPQYAYNRIAPGGSYGGLILWHAAWSLWYTTAAPPTSGYVPAVDPTAGQVGTAPPTLPAFVQAPYSPADDSALPSGYVEPLGTIYEGGP
jgi:hypothetical protein